MTVEPSNPSVVALPRREPALGFSRTTASPWPEPYRALRNAVASVSTYRVPVAPNGWPMATAPPLGVSFSSGIVKPPNWFGSSRSTPSAGALNAS